MPCGVAEHRPNHLSMIFFMVIIFFIMISVFFNMMLVIFPLMRMVIFSRSVK